MKGSDADEVELELLRRFAFPYHRHDLAQHPTRIANYADYIATNLGELLRSHPEANTGDWYHEILEWCDRHCTGEQWSNSKKIPPRSRPTLLPPSGLPVVGAGGETQGGDR